MLNVSVGAFRVETAFAFYIPPHDRGRVLWYHVGCLCVRPSVRMSYVHPTVFSFPDDYLSKNLACALILSRSSLGLLIGKFREFFTFTCPRQVRIFICGR